MSVELLTSKKKTFLENHFRILKRVGGTWLDVEPPGHKQVDGDKFVCMDHIVQHRRCLVYSFGIANDWSFEDQMDTLGNIYFPIDAIIGYSLSQDVKSTPTIIQSTTQPGGGRGLGFSRLVNTM